MPSPKRGNERRTAHPGIVPCPEGKWDALINVTTTVFIGTFDSQAAAARAYRTKFLQLKKSATNKAGQRTKSAVKYRRPGKGTAEPEIAIVFDDTVSLDPTIRNNPVACRAYRKAILKVKKLKKQGMKPTEGNPTRPAVDQTVSTNMEAPPTNGSSNAVDQTISTNMEAPPTNGSSNDCSSIHVIMYEVNTWLNLTPQMP